MLPFIALVYLFSIITSLIFIQIPNKVYKDTGLISLIQDCVFIVLTVLFYEQLSMIQIIEYMVTIARQLFFIKYYYEPNGMTDNVKWTILSIVVYITALLYQIVQVLK